MDAAKRGPRAVGGRRVRKQAFVLEPAVSRRAASTFPAALKWKSWGISPMAYRTPLATIVNSDQTIAMRTDLLASKAPNRACARCACGSVAAAPAGG